MSVAFDDHGETVPGRGTTTSSSPRSASSRVVRTVGQQAVERRVLGGCEVALHLDEVPVDGGDAGDGVVRAGRRERGQELGDAERRQRVAPAQREKVRHVRRRGT